MCDIVQIDSGTGGGDRAALRLLLIGDDFYGTGERSDTQSTSGALPVRVQHGKSIVASDRRRSLCGLADNAH